MRLEDAIFFFGSIILSLSLLPSLFTNAKPAPWTSAVTTIIMVAFGYGDWRLGLPLAMAAQVMGGGLWATLWGQKFMSNRRPA